ncbi:multidrug ABC transporter permease [Candidatus Gottesmanbacteria bacterium RIFOXYB1_FULL_47_11]|uniref:Transport permease protein n=1 Tax=Candidatus Gottesmanbacteria bacterium RIFOXYB1_FULL_47_11 TaxID=1798401 RepID=A0A1F6BEB3_9BACT|nr:MAG: multidrug ABC transporter permease [Candidatus Gottesmanbacteria bacterium RIFOXYB1_FULL_47_11]
MSAIYILWLRQLKRYLRSRSRIIGSLGQPVLFLVALGFGFGPTFQKAGQGNYIQFLVPGIVAMSVLFTALFSGIEIIWDRQFGFLKEILVAPVSRMEIMIGRTIGGATVAMIQGTIVFAISFLAGFRPPSAGNLAFAFVFMFLTAVLFTALGTAIASKLEDMQGFQLIMNFLIMPLFFLSGALFPVDSLPGVLKMVVAINPLSYGVDGMRGALGGITHFGLSTDFAVLSIMAVVILAVGSYLFSKIQL